jgi:hypothetical protein
MTQSQEHNLVSPEAMTAGYEPQRISIRGLLLFIVIFAVSMVVLQALLWWLMRGIEGHDQKMDEPRSALKVDQQPPAPNLQPSLGHETFEYQDLEQQRHEEDQVFSRMGWRVDMTTHRVQIPPAIVNKVAEQTRARAAGPFVPPTTTGKNSNTILPAPATRPIDEGSTRP